jgi:DNA-directed RNA polymerase subunit RPC12/RpoP
MKKWLENFKYSLQRFMQGRYGYDELSWFFSIAGLILLLLSALPYLSILYFIAIALLIWSWFRAFSKNVYKRQIERSKYLNIKNKVTQKFRLCKNVWHERKTHKYYKCPHCKAVVRVIKPEKGRTINIHCPKCGNSFNKKT